jgi:hypothetical protein
MAQQWEYSRLYGNVVYEETFLRWELYPAHPEARYPVSEVKYTASLTLEYFGSKQYSSKPLQIVRVYTFNGTSERIVNPKDGPRDSEESIRTEEQTKHEKKLTEMRQEVEALHGKTLARLGASGWELVSIQHALPVEVPPIKYGASSGGVSGFIERGQVIAYLKRSVQPGRVVDDAF